MNEVKFVIMHKGEVHKGLFFNKCEQARNWVKFNYPKKTFKEPQLNVFVCNRQGTTFKIVELKHYQL
jgi:hypothetical protein